MAPVSHRPRTNDRTSRPLGERLPGPPEAFLAARDALKTVRHSASLTRSLVLRSLFGEDDAQLPFPIGLPMPDEMVHRVFDTASSLTFSFLPPALRPMSGAVVWDDIVAAAASPDECYAWRFSRAAYGAMKLACAGEGGKVLISELRLFSAYRAALAERGDATQPIDFVALLMIELEKAKVVLDVGHAQAGGSPDRLAVLRRAILALGLLMASASSDEDNDLAGRFAAAVDLARAVGDEISAGPLVDAHQASALVRRYKDHL